MIAMPDLPPTSAVRYPTGGSPCCVTCFSQVWRIGAWLLDSIEDREKVRQRRREDRHHPHIYLASRQGGPRYFTTTKRLGDDLCYESMTVVNSTHVISWQQMYENCLWKRVNDADTEVASHCSVMVGQKISNCDTVCVRAFVCIHGYASIK